MKIAKLAFAAVAVGTAAVSFRVGTATGAGAPFWRASTARGDVRPTSPPAPKAGKRKVAAGTLPTEVAEGLIENYCRDCHNDQLQLGTQSFDSFTVAKAFTHREQAEKMIRKLRTEMMPLPGVPRPPSDTLQALAATLEEVIDKATPINPGSRPFQRLNRPEYQAAIRDLVGVDFDPADYLPLDTKSANFDNIADVQALSTTLLESYLNAASAVSRMAVGDRNATLMVTNYRSSPYVSQHPWDHVDGAPYGTRGGIVATHDFPADGKYQITMDIEGGVGTSLENIDVSIDGKRASLLKYDKGVNKTNGFADKPLGMDVLMTDSLQVAAGQHKVTVSFVRQSEGPYEDLIRPHDWSTASSGNASAGTTLPPRVNDFTVSGPFKVTGLSETPSRKMIFSCHPSKTLSDRACGAQIMEKLGTRAYRRPLTLKDRDGLMRFYDQGAKTGGFEEGVRMGLQAMLASPYFVFRFEPLPANAVAGKDIQVSDIDLASRLSFFLWGSIPDETLLNLAKTNQLHTPAVLQAQVTRMLKDERSEALATRFAGQWLRLQDLDKVHPDAYLFPDFNQQLADAMRRETELFFNSIVKDNRSVLDLFSANYTYVNEELARHYGIPNVSGDQFRRVQYPDSTRRGILGQGSVLVQTSLANRTSPVLRGKWVMEVLIGMPPPPPPPNIPSLDETADGKDGKPLTTRERMEIHRKNPTCKACHQYMDPIGLSLDNFDVTGRWRYRENAVVLDTKGTYYDLTPVATPSDLSHVLLKRPIPLMRNFAENMLAYATGRRMEAADQTLIRQVTSKAAADNYKFSAFVMGTVNSPVFRERRVEAVVADDAKDKQNNQQR
ncbi:MAG TPA: DUF1592 domain-containing protein [Gemmatimonadaceae bacterium]|jgi:hypothetical protein